MLKDVFRSCRTALEQSGIENADFEALCLLEHVTGYDRAGLIAHGGEPVSDAQQTLLNSLTEKRLAHVPLQYLLGTWSFMGFPLSVGEGVLIPRDDTEVCVNLALAYLKDKPAAKVFDLCAGSGAIAIALSGLAHADVTAVELSDRAFYFLEKNIEQNHLPVHIVHDDVLTCHRAVANGSLDLIISNPPYIPRGELESLQKEVRFEPVMALDGGTDGLDFYRAILNDWTPKLKRGGALVLELGEEQAAPVAQWMTEQGYADIRTAKDFGNCDRALIGSRA